MDVTKIPFNQYIGLKLSIKSEYLLMLDNCSDYRNHLDTVHASAQFALAEATGGFFLLDEFSELTDKIVPVVRKVETNYKKPASSAVFSKAQFIETEKNEVLKMLNERGRMTLKVAVSLFDETDVLVMQSVFEWFISKKV